jgi:hypothetical protein
VELAQWCVWSPHERQVWRSVCCVFTCEARYPGVHSSREMQLEQVLEFAFFLA